MSGETSAGASRRRTTNRARTLLAAALLGASSLQAAWAQPYPPALAQAGVRDFNIAGQSLADGLIEFARQSGLQVSAETGVVGNVRTAGVRGRMTPDQALAALLSGTGLAYRLSGTMVVVENARTSPSDALQLDPVRVQGYPVPAQAMIDNLPPPYAGGQVATGGQLGLLGNRDVMNTPFNQTNYTAQKAQDQQAKTVRDVLVDDPSVRFFVPDASTGADTMFIRGFMVQNASTTYGGLYGMLPSATIMAELAERIEVLKGPSAMLNGMPPQNSIGGTVNVVPKRAPDTDLTQLTASYVSGAQFGGHADVARRFGNDKQFGVRFNGAFKAGQTDVEWNSDQRALAVLGLDFRGEHVRLAADLGYQSQYIGGMIPYLGVADNVPMPWAPDARKNQGQPWGYHSDKDLFGVFRAEIDLTERVTAYASFGAHDYRDQQLNAGTAITVADVNGNATSTPLNFSAYNTILAGQAGVRGLVDTGPIGHELSVIATTYERTIGNGLASLPAVSTNIYSPNVIAPLNMATPAAAKVSTATFWTLGVADTLSAADKRIQLTVGARLQQVTTANFNRTTGVRTSNYDQGALSPSVALVFKPVENVTIYGNWIQGLQEGSIVGSQFANAGEIFPPYKSNQYEAGIKADWGKFTTTFSAFQISQPSILTNVTANTQFLGGEQRNQGLEFNVFGEPLQGVRLLGGMMLLSGVLTKTQGGLTDGWIAPFAPAVNLNLAGEWDLPFVPGLTLNGRVIYTSSQYIDTTWPRRSLADWTRFDVGVRYAFDNPGAKGQLLIARFNVENLLDADYWAGGNGTTTLTLGAPRTFRVSLTANF
ncbi:TonB-dependent receptor [Reyranella soli]|jgi:iron complex outermembrane receptor protein|uniref:TonB-dependent receptor n=1 Tax=Reyranella soli TaxID=1230389 RepID=A0A512NC11_9HYPH|nr:TonB-dependent receptor [Reyranella soli]GEP56482.1 TonB-dependent receptor [Reyranella soli]